MATKASSTAGVEIDLTTGVGTAVTGLSFTAGKPATLTGTALTLAAGDVISISKSGSSKLDGTWIVAATPAPTATAVTLMGSDTTGETAGALPGTAVVTHFAKTDLTGLCLASFDVSVEQPGTLAVGTFCEPSATLPVPATSAGTVAIAGFTDITDAGYLAIMAAAGDNKPHTIRIKLPNNGFLVMEGQISGLSWQVALNEAQRWSATITLSKPPVHVF